MNVFEDLITDLKRENLLEDTVIDESASLGDNYVPELRKFPSDTLNDEPPTVTTATPATEVTTAEFVLVEDEMPERVPPSLEDADAEPNDASKRATRGKEFFKNRAISEVSSLQMVEHVLTGVEREYLKVVPRAFDDFNAKMALNVFLQAVEAEDQAGHAEAEFALMQETESWCSALAERDKTIPVSSIRLYCENTRPALSSQALLAIARFYRNLPFSEPVRAKFDFVITRLFSRTVEHGRRVCLFNRTEVLAHINTMYSEWASVPLYTADDDGSKVMLTALSFEDLAVEAENASSFDQLIRNDFFGRLRLFKESVSEIFFAPEVTAAAIEANVRIGNAYVTLIAREKEKLDSDTIEDKYSDLDQQGVSDSLATTLQLVDVLKNAAVPVAASPDVDGTGETASDAGPKVVAADAGEDTRLVSRILRPFQTMNRWVLAFSAVMLVAAIGLVIWSNMYGGDSEISTEGVISMQFNDLHVTEHIKIAKMSNGVLYVQLQPSWDSLPKEKREDVLERLYKAGTEKGYSQVQLISQDGENAGYAGGDRLDIVMP